MRHLLFAMFLFCTPAFAADDPAPPVADEQPQAVLHDDASLDVAQLPACEDLALDAEAVLAESQPQLGLVAVVPQADGRAVAVAYVRGHAPLGLVVLAEHGSIVAGAQRSRDTKPARTRPAQV